jgi:hypothetical protein
LGGGIDQEKVRRTEIDLALTFTVTFGDSFVS